MYEYEAAYQFVEKFQQAPRDLLELLHMLKERRELNIKEALEMGYVLNEDPERELLANYLLDLEVKLKKAQIIDFVRAVSPIIYRLFFRLIYRKIPDIDRYIQDYKDHQYDTWRREVLSQSDVEILRQFKPERNVTSDSLTNLIQLLDYPFAIKEAVRQLRQLERSVRNPLAHLIKPFDEAELKRTTNFSSQKFMNLLIELARATGVRYDKAFYFDQMNQEVLALYDEFETKRVAQ